MVTATAVVAMYRADGFAAHARQFFEIGEGRHAGDEGGEDQRHGNELEQVHEDVAKGNDPVVAIISPS